MRGFGDSSYNKPFGSLKELAGDVKLFADRMGLKEAYVIGWSTGGGVALELAAAEPQFVKAVFSIEGASHKGYPIFKKDEKGMPIVGSLYSSPDEMGEDPVQVKPVSLAFAAKNFQATDALWKATIYVVNKPSQKDNEILINETMKQVCLNELDWSLANINMSDSPNFYQKGDDTIKNVVCPCAFTSGELDMVVPRYMVMENVNAVKNSKLLAYEKCGHSPLVDCPDRLIKDITEFFA
ncbi:MAG: alpha/beta fold hydrolase [Christensenellales bacterium]